MNNIEKAKKLMMDRGWMTKYHFILNVMNGNKKSKVPRHETRLILWAREVLEQELNWLKKKHPMLQDAFNKVSRPYYDELRTLHENVLDIIFDNIKNGTEEDKQKAIQDSLDDIKSTTNGHKEEKTDDSH